MLAYVLALPPESWQCSLCLHAASSWPFTCKHMLQMNECMCEVGCHHLHASALTACVLTHAAPGRACVTTHVQYCVTAVTHLNGLHLHCLKDRYKFSSLH